MKIYSIVSAKRCIYSWRSNAGVGNLSTIVGCM